MKKKKAYLSWNHKSSSTVDIIDYFDDLNVQVFLDIWLAGPHLF